MKVFEAIRMKMNVDSNRIKLTFYYVAKFLGLAPVIWKKDKFYPAGFCCKAYSVFLIALHIISITISICSPEPTVLGSLNSTVIVTMFILHGALACSALLTLLFKGGKIAETLNNINAIEDELKNINSDSKVIEGRFFENTTASMIATYLVVLFSKLIIHFIHLQEARKNVHYMIRIGKILRMIGNYTMIIMFVEFLLRITRNFQHLNEHLRAFHIPNLETLSTDDTKDPATLATGEQPLRFHMERFDKMRKLHRRICELVESTTDVIAVPIFIFCVYSFCLILPSSYLIYAAVSELDRTTEILSVMIPQIAPPIVIVIFKLFMIVNAASSTCVMGNATNGVLIKVWNKYRPQEMRDDFIMFTFQLLHNPVAVRAFGFFKLDYSLIYKIVCALVTYSVTLIQLDPLKPPNHTHGRLVEN